MPSPNCQIAALASLFFFNLATNLASAVSLPANPLNFTAPLLECRGDEPYGKGLDDQSCGHAWSQIPQDDRLRTWAVRGTGVAYSYWLPRLFASPDGKCVVQPMLQRPAKKAVVSYSAIRSTARALTIKCARKRGSGSNPSMGFAANFGDGVEGGYNNLLLYVQQVSHDIRCAWSPTPVYVRRSCHDILDRIMPIDDAKAWFGPRPLDPVYLPFYFQSDDRKCILKIYSNDGLGDFSSWYTIWWHARIISTVCGDRSRNGIWDFCHLSIALGTPTLIQQNSTVGSAQQNATIDLTLPDTTANPEDTTA